MLSEFTQTRIYNEFKRCKKREMTCLELTTMVEQRHQTVAKTATTSDIFHLAREAGIKIIEG